MNVDGDIRYNDVGVPRVTQARIDGLTGMSIVALAAHCDQVRAGPMTNDTLHALLKGIARVAPTTGRECEDCGAPAATKAGRLCDRCKRDRTNAGKRRLRRSRMAAT